MGSVTVGAPRAAIQKLRDAFALNTFVETGTYQGDSSAWASEVFGQVLTIEGTEAYYHEARQRHAARTNIEFLLGDSRTLLTEIVARLSSPALFWLDAHWMGGEPQPGAPQPFGRTAECPVLREIEIINSSPLGHFILIDDARFLLAPPPRPHRAADWPDVVETLAALNSPDPRYTVIYDDVITSVPQACRSKVEAIFYDLASDNEAAKAAPGSLGRRILRRLRSLIR